MEEILREGEKQTCGKNMAEEGEENISHCEYSKEENTSCKLFSKETRIKYSSGASLVAQWIRICLPMQGTQVRSLVWEDPTCRGATKPMRHNY